LRKIVTLTTDFGMRDGFVAAMKGVILGINDSARLVDVSHEIEPGNILEAVYILEETCDSFPGGTIHVCVVDPGVGSGRRPLLVASGGQYFVGPDNGVFTHVLEAEENRTEIYHLTNGRYFGTGLSRTFHGRDIFAPVAAWLSLMEPCQAMGQLIHDPVILSRPRPVTTGEVIEGEIAHTDRFGNLITNITSVLISEVFGADSGGNITIAVGGLSIRGLSGCYQDASVGTEGAIINSFGRLEIFVSGGNAAAWLRIDRGSRVVVSLYA